MNVGKSGLSFAGMSSAKLTKAQKVELAEWNRNNPRKDGSSLKKRKAREKDNRHTKACGMTVTGALPPCGKIKYKLLCCRIKGPHFWV